MFQLLLDVGNPPGACEVFDIKGILQDLEAQINRLDEKFALLEVVALLKPGLQMLHALDLKSKCAFVVLDVLELHRQEAYLALKTLHVLEVR